ncbi:MAG: hypothetical protein AB9Q20_14765 [Candidatus Reddybacter sp.]
MLIAFKDNDKSHCPDETGYNKVGYITHSNIVIFQYKKRMVKKELSTLRLLPHQLIPINNNDLDIKKVNAFFENNVLTFELFHIGLTQLLEVNTAYFNRPIKLPKHNEITIKDHDTRWRELILEHKNGDALLTFDTESLFSKLISIVDKGPWSHVALCTGEGTVIEALTGGGVQERPIEVYENPKYRVGLYRFRNGVPEPEKGVAFGRAQIGKPYNFSGAAIAGIQKIFMRQRIEPTPNDIAIQPELDLIVHV